MVIRFECDDGLIWLLAFGVLPIVFRIVSFLVVRHCVLHCPVKYSVDECCVACICFAMYCCELLRCCIDVAVM